MNAVALRNSDETRTRLLAAPIYTGPVNRVWERNDEA